ncbi:PREDICTED: mucin-2 [Pygoscelis adeliae]|nr:PREDICTED: mucin-2 [Pygoscelis adeliae]
MGLRIASLFMLWLALSYANEIRKGRTRNHGHYVCSTWGNNHFKTFDGDIYQFPGICEYNFASDCRESYKEFSVHIQRALNSNNHPEIQYILVTIKDFTVYLRPKLAVVDGRIVKTPYYSSGVLIESNDIYTKVYAKLGLTLIWNQEDALMVELDSKFNNHTCGLCGDYNGVPIYNEFFNGVASYSSITYGNLQKISKPNAKCEDPDETQAIPSCNGHRDECERLLTSSAFADCRLRLNLEMYIQACMQDKCACNGNEDDFCLCSTISQYSRQCSHAGGRPGEWRTQYFCPKTCPDTMIYKESSSPCMDTCSHLEISSLCEEHYMDGCFCPEGTVYDDITEKGCIPASQCHCKLHGKEYSPGESITNECEECTCDSGRWTCKDLPCPGTCSLEGGSHITTFDGKKYTFHGDCYYVLAKGVVNDSHALLAELAPCGSTDRQTCLKTVVLLVDHKKNVVVFRSDGSVLLNEMTVNVPYVSASFSVFKPSSYYLVVQTSFGLQLQIQLFPVMQLFATVDQSVQGKLQGLCGNFNGMEGDDFKTASGLVEATGSAFANTWKAQSTCTDQVEKLEDPCSLSIESANYAEHWCSLLKNSEGPFARCHLIIDPSDYYKKCKYDTCLCEDNEKCLCAALSSYSRACAFKGIILGGWRKSVCSKEVSACPGNQIFLYNLTMCQQTCRSLADGEKHCLQDFAPVDGCGCPYNTYLDNKDTCVPISKCPCFYKGSYLEPGEYVTKDGERCVCRNAKVQCTSVTIRTKNATECSSNKMYFDCNASPKWTSQTPVQLGCHTPRTDHFQAECVSGCVCPEGLFDDGKGGCVEEKDCPCIHNNQWYSPGQKITVDCNTCTCQKGVWSCTEDVCYGTCMIYGSGHYITFDGKFYDFDGSCEYVATQDFCGDKNSSSSFSIITENVPCGTTGVTCSKAIKMFLGKTELKLENKDYKEIQRDIGDDVRYGNRTVGLYLVIEASNGVMLIWDKKTTVFIKLTPDYKGKVCGLCGNFDDKSNNDFTTRSGLQETNALKFGNSWKQSSMCPDITQEIKPCDVKPHRKSWAEKECSIIRSEVFKICHSKVDPIPFYEACVHDACSCDSGGDCECFCSAVAAYAQECTKAQACVFWRTPDICPVFCDYYNPRNECDWHYEPCGSNVTTCRMINNVSTNFSVPYLEGCYPRCPKDKPVYNEETKECVPGDKCWCYINGVTPPIPPGSEIITEENCTKCVCGPSGSIQCTPIQGCPCVINGTHYKVGETVAQIQDGNICITYVCAENGSIVVGSTYPCPTSTSPTTISTSFPTSTLTTTVTTTSPPVTTTPCFGLICNWTEWFDVSKPEEHGGDYETYDAIRSEHGNKICEAPERIECRAKDRPDVSLEELGQKVECNVTYGLICKNEEQDATLWRLCYNYEIRVNCCEWHEISCEITGTPSPTPTATSTTTRTTVPIMTTARQPTTITTMPVPTPTITSEAPPSSTTSTVSFPHTWTTTPTPTPSEPPSTTATTTMPPSSTTSSTPGTTMTVPGTPTSSCTFPTPIIITKTPLPPISEPIKSTPPASGIPTKTSTTVIPSATPLQTTRTTEIQSTVSTMGTTIQQSTPSVSTSPVASTTSGGTETESTPKTTTSGPTSAGPPPQSTTILTETPSHETTTTTTGSPPTQSPTTTVSTTSSGPSSPEPTASTTVSLPSLSTSPVASTTSGGTETESTPKTTTSGPTSSGPPPQSTTILTETPSHETTTTTTGSPPTRSPTTTVSTTSSGPSSPEPTANTTVSLPSLSTSPVASTTSGGTETESTPKTTTSGPSSSGPPPQSTTILTETPSHETTTTTTGSPPTQSPTTTVSTTSSGPSSPEPTASTTGSLPSVSTSPVASTTSGVTEKGSTTKTPTSGPTSAGPPPQSTTILTETPSHETTTTTTGSPPTRSPTTTVSTTSSGPSSPEPTANTTVSLPSVSTSPVASTTSGVTETGSTTKTPTSGPTSSGPPPQSTTIVTETPSHETTTTTTGSPPTRSPTTTVSTTSSGPSSPEPTASTTVSLPSLSTSPVASTTSGVTETGSTTKTTTSGPTSAGPPPQSTTIVTETPSHETTTTTTGSPPTRSPTTTVSTTSSGPSSPEPTANTTVSLPSLSTSPVASTTSGGTETESTPKTTTSGPSSSGPPPQSTTIVTETPSHETTTTTTGSPPTQSPTTTVSTTSSGPSSPEPTASTTVSLPSVSTSPVASTTSGGTETESTPKTTTSGPTSAGPPPQSTTILTETPSHETTTTTTGSPPTQSPTTTVSTTSSGPSSPEPTANTTVSLPSVSTSPVASTTSGVTEKGSTTKTPTSGPTSSGPPPQSTTILTETPSHETTTTTTGSPPTRSPTTTVSTTSSGPSSPEPTASTTVSLPLKQDRPPRPPLRHHKLRTILPRAYSQHYCISATETGSTTKTTTSGPTSAGPPPQSTTILTETPSHETTTTTTGSPPTQSPTTTVSTTSSGPSSPEPTASTTVSLPSLSTSPVASTTSGVTEKGSTTKTTTSGPTSSGPPPQSTTILTETPSHETTTTTTGSPPTRSPTTTVSTTSSGPSSPEPTASTTSTTILTETGSSMTTTATRTTPTRPSASTTMTSGPSSPEPTASTTVSLPSASTSPMSVTTSGTTPTESFTTTSGTTSSNFTTVTATTTTTTSGIVSSGSTSTSWPTATSSAVTIPGSSMYSTVTPLSASGSTTSLPPTTPGRNCSILPNESHVPGESWWLCNCTKAICIEDNIIQVVPIICNPPPKPTCANGLSPVQVIDEDGCCWHWECDCYCTGWGDPHYMTFDGLYYSYQGNCTYVLVEEIYKKVDNFGVYIDNYHCDTRDVVSCPRTLIVRHETQEVRIATVKPNTLQVKVTVNKQAVALPYKKFGLSIYESGINRVVEIPELKMNVTYNGLSFSIRMPYRLFGNNTHGQCGTCNNNTADDCMLPNGNIAENCETMADHWQVVDPSKPQCSPGLIPTKAPSTTPMQPCKESSICKLLLGSLFEPCHGFVRPEKYYAACVFDSCVVPNLDLECSSLQVYAATCADQSVCIDWRSHTNGVCCTYKCPSDKEYRACGPIKEITCKSSQQNETSTKQMEGCFCPNGTMLYDSGVDVCVKTCGCLGLDKIPREFGEKFTVDCQDCICLEGGNGIVCEPHECAKQNKTSCDGEGFYEVNEVNSEDSCCPIVTCKCNTSLCTTKVPKCTVGFEVHSHIPSGQCCPVYQCVPKRVCVHQNAEFLPNSSVFVDKCQNCFCTNEVNVSTQLNIISCEHIPCNTYCEPGYEHQPVKGECCGRCVQTKCVIHTANNSDLILSPGEFKSDPYNNCTIYSCVNIHNQLLSSTSEITCPAFNEENCKPGTITFLPNGCCKTCIPLDSPTLCSVRQRKDFIFYKSCRSVDRVVMTECEGKCGTFSLYSADANSMEHSCSCCRESRTTVREVELKCPTGHSISHKYIYVESCSCQDHECLQSSELQSTEENDKASTLNRIKRAISLTSK